MVSIQDMANSYIEQLKFRIGQTESQLVELQQHLQECENEVQFGKANYENSPQHTETAPLPRTLFKVTCRRDIGAMLQIGMGWGKYQKTRELLQIGNV